MNMAETKTHEKYGEVEVLERSAALVRIATSDGDEFWVTAASFAKAVPKVRAKKPKHLRKKKIQMIRKVDDTPDLAEEILVISARGEELPDGIEVHPENDLVEFPDENIDELEVQRDDTEIEVERNEVWQVDGPEEAGD
jgi:hypothetical protein